MILIDVKTDNITDYKKTSLLIAFPYCTGKCKGCQNEHLRLSNTAISVSAKNIAKLYDNVQSNKAIVMAGLEPFDSFADVLDIISTVGKHSKRSCDFVVYTGYNEQEYKKRFEKKLVQMFKEDYMPYHKDGCLIVKIGRYDNEDREAWYNNTLGVDLINKSQFTIQYNTDGSGYIEKYKEN